MNNPFEKRSKLIVPYKEIVPYQGIILKIYQTISTKNPVGLGLTIGGITALCLMYYILDPPFLTSIALFLYVAYRGQSPENYSLT